MNILYRAKSEFRRILVILALFSLFINLLLLTMPLYMLQIYDRILPSRSTDTLAFLTIIAVSALVILGLLEMVRTIVAARAAARLDATLGADALVVSINQGRNTQGDIQPMRDLAAVRSLISSRAIFALLDLPFAPIFIGILYLLHSDLFWLTLIGAVILFIIAILNQWTSAAASRTVGKKSAAALGSAQAFARNSETLKAMGMVDNGIDIWGKANADALIARDKASVRGAIFTGLSRTIRTGLQITILGYGAYLVLADEMSAGMIFASSIISGRGLQPIDQVIGGWRQYVSAWSSWKRLRNSLSKVPPNIELTEMPPAKGEISAKGLVVFGPDSSPDNAILKRVSFALRPGASLGIVGPSGAGKSTLARVLVGAIIPRGGEVRLDGANISNWSKNDLGRQIGYLSQEVELLPGTVAQNISRLAGGADSADVLEAAKKAGVHELILKLPKSYDTYLGPGGFSLSGGQRQRIALARAFFGDPKLMILDEPNANLDESGDNALGRALTLARENGTTVILITQRPQILNSVDKILRLHDGVVDFFGTRKKFVAKLKEQKQNDTQRRFAKQQSKSRATAQPTGNDGKKLSSEPGNDKNQSSSKPEVKASFGSQVRAKP